MAWHGTESLADLGGARSLCMQSRQTGSETEMVCNTKRVQIYPEPRRTHKGVGTEISNKNSKSFFLYKSNKGTTSSCSSLGFQHSPGALVLQRDIITKLRVLVLESGALFGVPFPFWNFFYVSPLRSFQ